MIRSLSVMFSLAENAVQYYHLKLMVTSVLIYFQEMERLKQALVAFWFLKEKEKLLSRTHQRWKSSVVTQL